MVLWVMVSLFGSIAISLLTAQLAITRLRKRVQDWKPAEGELAEMITEGLERQSLGTGLIREKLLSTSVYASLLPQIEVHIDQFLNVRLKEQMPVVGMLVGERTIAQMKGIFLNELEALFPEVMDGYLSTLEKDDSLKDQMTKRIIQLVHQFSHRFTNRFLDQSSKKIFALAAYTGLFVSMFNLLIYFLSKL